jgi:pyruvate kinase
MPKHSQSLRRAKIICTLGPSSQTSSKISALIDAGMDVARLNFSHGTHEEHKHLIQLIRRISAQKKKSITILQDLQGPKIRILTFRAGPVKIKKGDIFTLTNRKINGDQSGVSVSFSSFYKDVKKGDDVLLDDGLIKLKVKEVRGKDVICKVINGGPLSDHKGLNLPGNRLSVKALTDKDKDDLAFGLSMDVDYIALSFVQHAKDIREIKKLIAAQQKDTPVIAKIEKPQAVKDIDKISDICDVVMIARGDLGVETSPEQVPAIQKKIIALCNRKGVPVITATQMLESMIYNPRPTRAEASDVANAVIDGSDALMLSGETASGKFPVRAVDTMHKIITLTENELSKSMQSPRRRYEGKNSDISSIIGYSASQAAGIVNAALIVCLTQTGSTARMIARFRPQQPLIAVTHTVSNLRRLNLVWGIRPYAISEFGENFDKAIEEIIKIVKKSGAAKKGDKIIVTAGLPFYSKPGTNMLRIEEIGG